MSESLNEVEAKLEVMRADYERYDAWEQAWRKDVIDRITALEHKLRNYEDE